MAFRKRFVSFAALLLLSGACLALPPASRAGDMPVLTSETVGRFVGSMDDVRGLSEKMKGEGNAQAFKPAAFTDAALSAAPGFSPYADSVAALKDGSPADYKRLESAVSGHGFKSAADWAQTGDAVMLSYVALKTGEANPQGMAAMEQMTPEMMEMMPPQAKAQFEKAREMMKAVQAVPPANREAVKPHASAIEGWGKTAGR